MHIKCVSIQNFRNFIDCAIEFEDLTLITGPNNSGKTNLFDAMRKVLALSSLRNPHISESDFNDLAKPIIIDIIFGRLSDHDKAAFYHPSGLVNGTTKTIKLHFEVFWDLDEQDVISECYFLRDDFSENQRITDFTRNYRDYINHYFTSAIDRRQNDHSLSQRSSFGKVIRSFAGDYLKPVEVLLSQVESISRDLNMAVEELDDAELAVKGKQEVIDLCKEIILFSTRNDLLNPEDEQAEVEITNDLSDLKSNCELAAINKLKDVKDASIEGMCETLRSQLDTLQLRLPVRYDLHRWGNALGSSEPFTGANNQLGEVFQLFLRDQNVRFQAFPIEDEQLIQGISAFIDEIPIESYGDGYKVIFDIGIKLAEVLATENLNKQKSSLTCLFIEDIEVNLHPHMQRHVINQLRQLQKIWRDDERDLQIILSTHSPSSLRRVRPEELLQMRSDSSVVKWSSNELDELASQLVPDGDQAKTRKKLKKLSNWADNLFTQYAETILSNVVIIVEGFSEQGFITKLAEQLSDPDYYGISVINADGGGDIQYICTLLSALKIPYICIADRKDEHNVSMIESENLFLTDTDNFETEIVGTNRYAEIILALEAYHTEQTMEQILGYLKGHGFPSVHTVDDLIVLIPQMDSQQEEHLIGQFKLDKQKNARFGQLLAKQMGTNSPDVYRNAITRAEAIAKDVTNGS